MMTTLAEKLDVDTLSNLLDAALKSGAAIDAMANSRLQAEQWWMTAGQALRGN